jgi:hypothetical protein
MRVNKFTIKISANTLLAKGGYGTNKQLKDKMVKRQIFVNKPISKHLHLTIVVYLYINR